MRDQVTAGVSLFGAVIVTALFVQACPVQRPAPVPIDASDAALVTDGPFDDDAPTTTDADVDEGRKPAASPCQPACDAWKAAGCKEGKLANCAKVVCDIIGDPHFVHYDLACVQKATTPAAIRACGAECTTQ